MCTLVYRTGSRDALARATIAGLSERACRRAATAQHPLLYIGVRSRTLAMRGAVALWLIAAMLLDGLADRSDAKQSQFRKKVSHCPPSTLAVLTSRRCLLPD